MCDGTGLTPKLGGARGGSSGGGLMSAPLITIRQLEREEFQKDFLVIDIREESEIVETNKKASEESKNGDESKSAINVSEIIKEKYPNLAFAEIPLGKVLSGSFQRSDEFSKLFNSRAKIAILCPRGKRAQVTADNLIQKTKFDVYVIKDGMQAFKKKFTTDDDWACILTHLNNDPEKVGIALNLCNAAAAKGKSVTLVLMHEAVYLGTQLSVLFVSFFVCFFFYCCFVFYILYLRQLEMEIFQSFIWTCSIILYFL